jgi:hypothetical protein
MKIIGIYAYYRDSAAALVAEALLQPEGGILLPEKGAVESKPQAGK